MLFVCYRSLQPLPSACRERESVVARIARYECDSDTDSTRATSRCESNLAMHGCNVHSVDRRYREARSCRIASKALRRNWLLRARGQKTRVSDLYQHCPLAGGRFDPRDCPLSKFEQHSRTSPKLRSCAFWDILECCDPGDLPQAFWQGETQKTVGEGAEKVGGETRGVGRGAGKWCRSLLLSEESPIAAHSPAQLSPQPFFWVFPVSQFCSRPLAL